MYRLVLIVLLVQLLFCRASAVNISYIPPGCDFNKMFIVMSKGRSGSGFIDDILARVVIERPYFTLVELLGANGREMSTVEDPLDKIQRNLCPPEGSKSPYTAFKWKPYYWEGEYMDALRWVAARKIPVLYSKRNPLDVQLSIKINHMIDKKEDEKRKSHCKANDAACVDQHMRNQLVTVDTSGLVTDLERETDSDDRVKSILEENKVNFMDVEYEHLTVEHSSNATVLRAWIEVFEFIAPQREWRDGRINMRRLKSSIASTTSPWHHDKIRNYDKVQATLRGTRFAKLLN